MTFLGDVQTINNTNIHTLNLINVTDSLCNLRKVFKNSYRILITKTRRQYKQNLIFVILKQIFGFRHTCMNNITIRKYKYHSSYQIHGLWRAPVVEVSKLTCIK